MKRSIRPTVPAISRRDFISAGIAGAVGGSVLPLADAIAQPAAPKQQPKRVAAVNSIFRLRSHAYHIVGRMVFGFQKDGLAHQPNLQVVRMYDDQAPADDLGPSFCQRHGIELVKTAADALGGPAGLDVDAVALIIEHGDYPVNEFGQILYPRYELFQQIVDVFQKSGKSIPVFCDKHLSYDHKKAAEMVATAKKMGFPLMAGSSLPVTWRRPELEFKLGTKITEALVASRGELEIIGIHALEALQCMVERRYTNTEPIEKEQGVKAVTCLQGDAVWKAGDDGLWSWELLEHAIGRSPSRNAGDIRANCRRFPRPAAWGNFVKGPFAFLIEYRDGCKGTVLQLDGHVADETFAAKIEGQRKPESCLFWL